MFGFELLSHGGMGWLAPYTTFDFAFAIVLIAAARAGFGTGLREWRAILRLIALLPVFVTAVFAVAMISRPGPSYSYSGSLGSREAGLSSRTRAGAAPLKQQSSTQRTARAGDRRK